MPRPANGLKVCSKCRIEKPVEEFYACHANSDGLYYYCKACAKTYQETRPRYPRQQSGTKTCSMCGIEKPVKEFHTARDRSSGLDERCKECKKRIRSATLSSRPRLAEGLKICSGCHFQKPVKEFHTASANLDGLTGRCKTCVAGYDATRPHNTRPLDGFKLCSKCHIEKSVKEFYADGIQFDGLSGCCKSCKKEYDMSPERKIGKAARKAERMKNDPIFRFQHNIRNLIWVSFKNHGFRKDTKTAQILCMSIVDFHKYIEAQFKPGWTLANQGILWDLDHIVPISSAKNIEDVIRLNHYSNFQPLECRINRYEKRNKLDYKVPS